MTRPVAKPVTNALFPDYRRLLARAERVAVRPIRRCEICDTGDAAMVRQQWIDGYVCIDSLGCGRRQNKTRRIR